MSVDGVLLFEVRLTLCGPCLSGEGEECHTPGCDLWFNRPPRHSLWEHVVPAIGDLDDEEA